MRRFYTHAQRAAPHDSVGFGRISKLWKRFDIFPASGGVPTLINAVLVTATASSLSGLA